MKRKQKWLMLSALLVITCLMAGCLPVAWVSSYADADKYKVGNFTYSADEVDSVYVHWYTGEVEFVQSNNKTLKVYESGETLVEAAKLHWYLNDGELCIEFCQAEYTEPIASGDKHLVVELPAGIDLVVNDAGADVTLGAHTLDEVAIYSISGRISVESLKAEKADIGTISGRLRLGEVIAQKRIRFVSTSGSIDVESMTAKEFEISSVSGSVTVNSLDSAQKLAIESTSAAVTINTLVANQVEITSVSGAVKLGLNRCKKLDVETNSGAVDITLDGGLGATIEGIPSKNGIKKVYTTSNGKYVIGNGAAQIKIETAGGAVTIQ